MKRILFTLAFFACISFVKADEFPSPQHQYTSSPSAARFEILQSSLAAMWTFRLDRYSGRVWQLVTTSDDDNKWEEMPFMGKSKNHTTAKPHFQLFTSGLAARHTFLIDNDTGKTWLIVTSKQNNKDGSEYEVNIWQPFAE